jgi:integrase
VGTGAVGGANKRLETAGWPPLTDNLTPHSLRRTFCSLRYALGESPAVVKRQIGHTEPGPALRVYEQVMEEDDRREADALRVLVEGSAGPLSVPSEQRATVEASS